MKRILILAVGLLLSLQSHAQTKEEAQALRDLERDSNSAIKLYLAHSNWILCKNGEYDPQLFRSTTSFSGQAIADVITALSPFMAGVAQAIATYSPMADEVTENAKRGELDLLQSKSYYAFLKKLMTSPDVQDDKKCEPAAGELGASLVEYLSVRAKAASLK